MFADSTAGSTPRSDRRKFLSRSQWGRKESAGPDVDQDRMPTGRGVSQLSPVPGMHASGFTAAPWAPRAVTSGTSLDSDRSDTPSTDNIDTCQMREQDTQPSSAHQEHPHPTSSMQVGNTRRGVTKLRQIQFQVSAVTWRDLVRNQCSGETKLRWTLQSQFSRNLKWRSE